MKTVEHDRAVFCVTDSPAKTIAVLDGLRGSGFRESEISLIGSQNAYGDGEIGVEAGTKAPEGAVAGAGSGALLGGALGWMAGIGALAIPGLGPFIAAGPIMAALGGAAAGSAVGGVTGGLIGMGFSEYEAKQYETYLKNGKSLISVSAATDEEVDRAKEIYESAGAESISVQRVVEND